MKVLVWVSLTIILTMVFFVYGVNKGIEMEVNCLVKNGYAHYGINPTNGTPYIIYNTKP